MARNHCTSENSNHTETQKQSTTPKTIMYERKCKECGRIFYSTAKNTQYCKSCSTLRRETQVKKNTETRRMKIGQTRNKITTGHAYNLDGKRVVIPNDYMLNAVSIFASYLGVSYGKFDSWTNTLNGNVRCSLIMLSRVKSARCAVRELLRARCSKSTRDKGCDKHERTLCYRSGTRHV